MKRRIIQVVLALLALGLVGCLVYYLSQTPRTDRVWLEELSKDTTVEFLEDGTVVLKNVRDYTYDVGAVRAKEWLSDVSINPKEIVSVWFVLEPFAAWEAIGHTYLTFELSDGSAYSFSVEARREAHEGYSPLAGMVRSYELAYTWGTERDFLTRRLFYLEHPVRMYPLTIEKELIPTIFKKLVEETQRVSEHPRFYNTLTANCTNVLGELINESVPDSIPYDLSWNLPGLSDTFLMRIGLIPYAGNEEETKTTHDLRAYKEQIMAASTLSTQEFGKAVRALQPFQNEARGAITP